MLTILGVLIAAVIGPALVSLLNARQQRASKQQDYDRLDAVADRAEKVAVAAAGRAEAVAAQAREAATLLLAANERVAEATQIAGGKLDAIHALVNSQLTAALQSELNATRRELAVLGELAAMRAKSGGEGAPETAALVGAATARIEELEKNLADRAEQTELAYWLVEEYAGRPEQQPDA